MKQLKFFIPHLCLLTAFIINLISLPCMAAQSTNETLASEDLKIKLRAEITGTDEGAIEKEYVIGYRDIIYVELYGEGSMAVGSASPETGKEDSFLRGRGKGAEVRADGRVSLRHIGDVYAVGLTLTQLADYVKKLYDIIYELPVVTVTLIQSNSRHYTVMGQVKIPGLYHLDFPLTIVKAVAKAGGFTEWANLKVTVIRPPGKQATVKSSSDQQMKNKKQRSFKFDYDDFLGGEDLDKNIPLQPGDIMVVH